MATTFERSTPPIEGPLLYRRADQALPSTERHHTPESVLIGGLVAGAVLALMWTLLTVAASSIAEELLGLGSSFAFEDLTAVHVAAAVALVVVAFFFGGWAAGSTAEERLPREAPAPVPDPARLEAETAAQEIVPAQLLPPRPMAPAVEPDRELQPAISRQRAS